MERITFRIPERQLEAIERRVERGEYPSRSEAIRDALRQLTGVSREMEREADRRAPAAQFASRKAADERRQGEDRKRSVLLQSTTTD